MFPSSNYQKTKNKDTIKAIFSCCTATIKPINTRQASVIPPEVVSDTHPVVLYLDDEWDPL